MRRASAAEALGFQLFVVLSPSRTGSNLLLNMLGSHPSIFVAGEILGMLHDRTVVEILDDFITRVPATSKAAGFKLFYYHPQDDGSGDLWKVLSSLPRLNVLHLRRRNILRAVVSRKIAGQVDVWSERIGSESTVMLEDKVVALTSDEVAAQFTQTRRWELEVPDRLPSARILEVFYEELVANTDATFRNVLSFLEVPLHPHRIELKKQNPESLRQLISNYDELKEHFSGTEWEVFFTD